MTAETHVSLTFSGTLGGSSTDHTEIAEIWSNTLNFGQTSAPTQDQVDHAWTAGAAFYGSSLFSTAVQLTQAKLGLYVAVPPSAKYPNGTWAVSGEVVVHVGSVWGTTGAPYFPWQIATTVTLRSTERGPKGRGRIYLPPTNQGIDGSTDRYTAAQTLSINTDFSTLAEALMATDGADLSPLVIASRPGGNIRVNGCQVGDVPDTQRRRRNALKETFSPLIVLGGV